MNFDALWPVITFILGIVVTFGIEVIRDVLTRRRSREEAAASRSQQLMDRRASFEVDNLHAAHSALTRLGRAVTRYHLLDREVAITLKVPYASRQLKGLAGESATGEEKLLAHQEAAAVARLILDNDLRAEVEKTLVDLGAVATSHGVTVEVAHARWSSAVDRAAEAQRTLAERIRWSYTDDLGTSAPTGVGRVGR